MSKTPVLKRPNYSPPVTSTRVPTGGFQSSVAPTPDAPAPGQAQQPDPGTYDQENLGFDIGKTSGNAIDDMTGLLDSGSDYMKRAESRGMQYANDRGLLNSTMGGEAAQAAAMDAALPLVQTQSSERNASRGLATDIYGQEDSQLHDFAVQDREFQQDERMLNLETSSKESLIALEQEYNLLMTNNENLSNTWSDITTGITDIFRAGLTVAQTKEALDYMLGPDVNGDGVRSGGLMRATLEFNASLSGGGATTSSGVTPPTKSPGVTTPTRSPGVITPPANTAQPYAPVVITYPGGRPPNVRHPTNNVYSGLNRMGG